MDEIDLYLLHVHSHPLQSEGSVNARA